MFQDRKVLETIKINWLRANKILLLYVYALVTISTIFVYSATRSQKFVFQNLLWIGIGSVLVVTLSFIDYKIFKK